MTGGQGHDERATVVKFAGLAALVCALFIPAAGVAATGASGDAPQIAWGAADDAGLSEAWHEVLAGELVSDPLPALPYLEEMPSSS